MIKEVYGDLVESFKNGELDAYAHQANCFCRMGRGIAPLLAKAEPKVREADNATEEGIRDKMGTFSMSDTYPNIYNVYGQYHWQKYQVVEGRNTDYDALEKGLISVKENMKAQGYRTLGLPLIGCGLAGGDWEGVVLPMIKKVFDNSNIDVTIFKLK
ncbi:phosphatase [Vibrio phage 5P1b]